MELRERKTAGLKEKLSEHYRNRNFTPSEKDASRMGQIFFWTMTISLFLETQFFLVPWLYWDSIGTMLLHTALIWFTLFESVINWAGTYFGQNNFATNDLKQKQFPDMKETPPGWYNCPTCQVDSPPRSFHCRHCNRCVLKRDHHCYFTDSCVGFYNHRFFVLFCLYMIWGNCYALFLQTSYLSYTINFFSWDGLTYIPLVAIYSFITGQLHIVHLLVIIHFCFCVMCLCGAVFFTGLHMKLVSSGFTSYEAFKGVHKYSKSTIENWRSVFGPLHTIPLQFLYPFRVDQGGDGSHWQATSKSVKGH